VSSGKGIYRDKKPVGATEKVLKSRVHLILLGSMFAYYSFSRLCLVSLRVRQCTICRLRCTICKVRSVVPKRTCNALRID
jgi:hypothetical protein